MIYFLDDLGNSKEKNKVEYSSLNVEKTIIITVDDSNFEKRVGKNKNNFYEIKLSKNFPTFTYNLCDAVLYNKFIENNVILNIRKSEFVSILNIYGNHSYSDPFLRDYEKKYLVHSTTEDNYKKIIKDGVLKSINEVNKEIVEKQKN